MERLSLINSWGTDGHSLLSSGHRADSLNTTKIILQCQLLDFYFNSAVVWENREPGNPGYIQRCPPPPPPAPKWDQKGVFLIEKLVIPTIKILFLGLNVS